MEGKGLECKIVGSLVYTCGRAVEQKVTGEVEVVVVVVMLI